MIRIKGEKLEVYVFSAGRVKVDAGSMHGVVPKRMWSRYVTPDEDNMMVLTLNCLLVHHLLDDTWLLVDTGVGEGLPEKYAKMLGYHRVEGEGLMEALKGLGVSPSDISYITSSHLHYDHIGGILDWATGELSFPNATLITQKEELNAALNPNIRTKPTYYPELADAISKMNLKVVEGDEEPLPYLRFELTRGHTYGHQVVYIIDPKFKLAFPGDLFPMPQFFHPLWIPAFDVQPDISAEVKLRLSKKFHEEGWVLILDHTPEGFIGKVDVDDKGRYRFRQLNSSELSALGFEQKLG